MRIACCLLSSLYASLLLFITAFISAFWEKREHLWRNCAWLSITCRFISISVLWVPASFTLFIQVISFKKTFSPLASLVFSALGCVQSPPLLLSSSLLLLHLGVCHSSYYDQHPDFLPLLIPLLLSPIPTELIYWKIFLCHVLASR